MHGGFGSVAFIEVSVLYATASQVKRVGKHMM